MSDYVDRTAAKKAAFFDKLAMNRICSLPAADVVERKRGEWIHRTGNRDECSNCGARYYQDLKEPFMNFCPNCGADMRGDSDV